MRRLKPAMSVRDLDHSRLRWQTSPAVRPAMPASPANSSSFGSPSPACPGSITHDIHRSSARLARARCQRSPNICSRSASPLGSTDAAHQSSGSAGPLRGGRNRCADRDPDHQPPAGEGRHRGSCRGQLAPSSRDGVASLALASARIPPKRGTAAIAPVIVLLKSSTNSLWLANSWMARPSPTMTLRGSGMPTVGHDPKAGVEPPLFQTRRARSNAVAVRGATASRRDARGRTRPRRSPGARSWSAGRRRSPGSA